MLQSLYCYCKKAFTSARVGIDSAAPYFVMHKNAAACANLKSEVIAYAAVKVSPAPVVSTIFNYSVASNAFSCFS